MGVSSRWIQLLLLALIGLLIGLYLYKNKDVIECLANLSLSHACLLFLLRGILVVGNGYLLYFFILQFNLKLKLQEWVGLAFITGLGNYIAPLSFGMVLRVAYLKRKHDFPYTDFVIILGSTYLINFFCVCCLGLVGSLFLFFASSLSWHLPAIFFLLTFALVLLILVPVPVELGQKWIFQKISNALNGWNIIRKDGGLLVKVTLITLVNIFVNGVSFWVAYLGLGLDVSLLQVFLISLVGIFSLLLNITPANLGVQEVVMGMASNHVLVGSGAEGVLAALVVRAVSIVLVFVGGGAFSFLLLDELKGALKK